LKYQNKRVEEVFYYEIWLFHHFFKNSLKYENEEIVVVATFKEPFATCGEWDKFGQRWFK